MVHDYAIDKLLGQIKRVSIDKLEDIRIWIDANDKLSDDVTLKNGVILMTCVIKNGDKLYRKLFLEEALYDEKLQQKHSKEDINKQLMPVVGIQ